MKETHERDQGCFYNVDRFPPTKLIKLSDAVRWLCQLVD